MYEKLRIKAGHDHYEKLVIQPGHDHNDVSWSYWQMGSTASGLSADALRARKGGLMTQQLKTWLLQGSHCP